MGPVRSLLFALAALAAVLLPAASAVALSYPVTSTADTEAKGTLRASIKEANAHTGADTIPIEVTGTIQLGSPLQVIFDPVSIFGPGAGQLEVRRADAAGAGFSIFGFSTDAGGSYVSGLTVSNGQAAFGGGIRNAEGSLELSGVRVKGNEAVAAGGADDRAEGGGVYSEGPLTVHASLISGNVARASDGTTETVAAGGGVAAFHSLTVGTTTVSGNRAEASGGGGIAVAQGGGLLTPDETEIDLSTISGNSVAAEDGGAQTVAVGGGITVFEAKLTSVTVTGNSATSSGGAFGANLDAFMTAVVRNTILSRPLGEAGNCNGETVSGGYNLDEDGSCEFEAGSDLVKVAAGLDPILRDNGGLTPTHALLSGSIAIDRGASFGNGLDQRGAARPSDFPAISNKEGGDGSDIGAFELQVPPGGSPAPPVPILVGTESSDRTAPRTRIISGPARVGFERRAKFRFTSSEGQSTFQCRVDRKPYRKCRSPYKLKVEPGKHHFRVRAIDRFGNVDRTAARFSWRVKPVG
ncbi:MAG TPA: choice-of-anchor Q domain-containing protein [Solirubrobacterales bacterium]|nr:choice-of-anchor Q domain-containing protein [Solirubrobacterales bacterium]